MVDISGEEDCTGILKILEKDYGKGYQSDKYIEKYWWLGDKVTMSFEQNYPPGEAILILRSNKLDELIEND